jgi:hypothetical protein
MVVLPNKESTFASADISSLPKDFNLASAMCFAKEAPMLLNFAFLGLDS